MGGTNDGTCKAANTNKNTNAKDAGKDGDEGVARGPYADPPGGSEWLDRLIEERSGHTLPYLCEGLPAWVTASVRKNAGGGLVGSEQLACPVNSAPVMPSPPGFEGEALPLWEARAPFLGAKEFYRRHLVIFCF